MKLSWFLALWITLPLHGDAVADEVRLAFRVGSKKFTESVILAEIAAQLAESEGFPATHMRELGGTRILWSALLRSEIDAYPEYTGTLREEILADRRLAGDDALRSVLAEFGIRMTAPLGFNNTYAIGIRKEVGERLGVEKISDLRQHAGLRFGFGNEFMDRADGWPALKARYGLPHKRVRGLDHDLAYRGLDSGTIDVMDLYATDAEVDYYAIRVLEDDLGHFQNYDAVIIYRSELAERMPEIVEALSRLGGKITDDGMRAMNARARLQRIPETRVAADFLSEAFGIDSHPAERGTADRLLVNTRDHLFLVGISLTAAILLSVPLGILAARRPRLGHVILGAVGIIQTIPTLALLVFMIPLLGIGARPAILALFLYSLLPIVRNTHAGLRDIAPHIRESAEALGLSAGARLRFIELPMASPAILAGIKTSAVINIGTATLGALIGAGGYGQPILTGIRLDDVGLILEGAVPAAILALLVQGAFELAERTLVPKGLRLAPGAK